MEQRGAFVLYEFEDSFLAELGESADFTPLVAGSSGGRIPADGPSAAR